MTARDGADLAQCGVQELPRRLGIITKVDVGLQRELDDAEDWRLRIFICNSLRTAFSPKNAVDSGTETWRGDASRFSLKPKLRLAGMSHRLLLSLVVRHCDGDCGGGSIGDNVGANNILQRISSRHSRGFPRYTKNLTTEPTFESFLGSIRQNVSDVGRPKPAGSGSHWSLSFFSTTSSFNLMLLGELIMQSKAETLKRSHLTLIELCIRNTAEDFALPQYPPRQHKTPISPSGLHLPPAAPRVSQPAMSRPCYFTTVGIPCYVRHHCERSRLKVPR